jgi:hypothetical protein
MHTTHTTQRPLPPRLFLVFLPLPPPSPAAPPVPSAAGDVASGTLRASAGAKSRAVAPSAETGGRIGFKWMPAAAPPPALSSSMAPLAPPPLCICSHASHRVRAWASAAEARMGARRQQQPWHLKAKEEGRSPSAAPGLPALAARTFTCSVVAPYDCRSRQGCRHRGCCWRHDVFAHLLCARPASPARGAIARLLATPTSAPAHPGRPETPPHVSGADYMLFWQRRCVR